MRDRVNVGNTVENHWIARVKDQPRQELFFSLFLFFFLLTADLDWVNHTHAEAHTRSPQHHTHADMDLGQEQRGGGSLTWESRRRRRRLDLEQRPDLGEPKEGIGGRRRETATKGGLMVDEGTALSLAAGDEKRRLKVVSWLMKARPDHRRPAAGNQRPATGHEQPLLASPTNACSRS